MKKNKEREWVRRKGNDTYDYGPYTLYFLDNQIKFVNKAHWRLIGGHPVKQIWLEQHQVKEAKALALMLMDDSE